MRDEAGRRAGPVPQGTHHLLNYQEMVPPTTPPARGASSSTRRGTEVVVQLEDDRGGLFQDGVGSGVLQPLGQGWVRGLAGFQAVLGGDGVVVVALAQELEVLAAGGWGFEAAVGRSRPRYWTWLERSVPKRGYWRGVVGGVRAAAAAPGPAE